MMAIYRHASELARACGLGLTHLHIQKTPAPANNRTGTGVVGCQAAGLQL